MVSIELFITFLVTTFIFAYIPGPAMLYTAAQTISRGKRSGFMAAFGIFVGGCFHLLLSSIGLTAVLKTIPFIFNIIKVLGSCYLVWLGINLITAQPNSVEITITTSDTSLKDSILIEVLNPKTVIFYLAFLPQFINTTSGFPVWVQFIILGLIVNSVFVSADIVCVFLASIILKKINKSMTSQKVTSIIGGVIFILLGIFLLFHTTS